MVLFNLFITVFTYKPKIAKFSERPGFILFLKKQVLTRVAPPLQVSGD